MKKLEEMMSLFEREQYLSGAVLITKNKEVLFEKAYGKASIQLDVPNTIDTKFHIASVTKMFIAAAALKLEEQGLLKLSEQPGTYIDELQILHPAMTLQHLLTHTSGLHDIYSVPNLRFEMKILQVEEGDFLTYLCGQQQLFEPGEKWEYSSTGFILMGYIMEKVTGLSYEELLDQFFFSPLGMKDTGLDNPNIINPGRAYGHSFEDGKYINTDNDKLSEIDAPGELFSTVKDLNKWCEALTDGSLLSQQSMQKMFMPYAAISFNPKLKYGLGWFLGENFRSIGGGTPGFKSEIWHFPEEKLFVTMLWNYEKVNSFELFEKVNQHLLPTTSS
ncbi:serine hydrolase [Alkalihalobacillus sp. AL-G]|uniref:serine hydrolase domain-containing protein n=1 Tax=Alkalihalobacillus sp. AL-G TaxID=2926399 RepID=UPI00272BBB6E|nr:serine hydrolase domain-containing protein [Alkalihalobacillus sp. AL-G]WLD94331.1 beta-lactamase family protein [Alkalihalobacillus sp. AL-G]